MTKKTMDFTLVTAENMDLTDTYSDCGEEVETSTWFFNGVSIATFTPVFCMDKNESGFDVSFHIFNESLFTTGNPRKAALDRYKQLRQFVLEVEGLA